MLKARHVGETAARNGVKTPPKRRRVSLKLALKRKFKNFFSLLLFVDYSVAHAP